MKKILFTLSVLALAVFSACSKTEVAQIPQEAEYEDLVIDVGIPEDATTRATSGTTVVGQEATISGVQIAIFDASGNLAAYKNSTGSTASFSFSLRTGVIYTACAVVNGPSVQGKTSLSEIEAVTYTFGDYNDPSADFAMYGKSTMSAALSSSNKSISISAERNVCRVNLVSCTVTKPTGATGTYAYGYAFLSNIPKTLKVSGATVATSATNNLNWYGRQTLATTGTIIDGSTYTSTPTWDYSAASCPVYFYAGPNAASDAITAYQTTWAATATRLVVVATWAGTTYYYPVAIPATAKNTCYDVTMTITGPGITDPQGPIPSNTSLSVSVSVAGWTAGTAYTPSY